MIDRWVRSRRSDTTDNRSGTRFGWCVRPIAVLVDLTVLFPREPHRSGRYQPNGLQLHKVVEGRLSCWALCEQGDWWGLVTYPVAYGSKHRTVTHWVPAWTLRRKG